MAFRFDLPSAAGLAAAVTLRISDVLAKIIIFARCDVLTMISVRSAVGFVFMTIWLRLERRPRVNGRTRWVSLAVGVLFAGVLLMMYRPRSSLTSPIRY